MLSRGEDNAGGKILQDGDSGWQKSFFMLPGPRHSVSAGGCGLFDSAAGALGSSVPVRVQSSFPGPVLCRAGRGKIETFPQRGEHHSQPTASMQSENFPLPTLALSLANVVRVGALHRPCLADDRHEERR